MNINKVTGELVCSREYLLFWVVAMETSQFVFCDDFSYTYRIVYKEEAFPLQIRHVVFDIP